MESCQTRKNVKTLSANNSKTLIHKLMKPCLLRDDNKVYLMVESSSQLTLYKRVIKQFKKFKDLFQSVAPSFPTRSLLF